MSSVVKKMSALLVSRLSFFKCAHAVLIARMFLDIHAVREGDGFDNLTSFEHGSRRATENKWFIGARLTGDVEGDCDAGSFQEKFPPLHERISREAIEMISQTEFDGEELVKMKKALCLGVRYNDQPTDFIDSSKKAAESVTLDAQSSILFVLRALMEVGDWATNTQEAHYGLLQHWHSQTPTPRTGNSEIPLQSTMLLSNGQVQEIARDQARIWWEQSTYLLMKKNSSSEDRLKSLFLLGHILHMLQDSFAPAHTTRRLHDGYKSDECGDIVHFTGYTFQDSGKHAKFDYKTCGVNCTRETRMRALYQCSQLASKDMIDMWLHCFRAASAAVSSGKQSLLSQCAWVNMQLHKISFGDSAVGKTQRRMPFLVFTNWMKVDEEYKFEIAGGSELEMAKDEEKRKKILEADNRTEEIIQVKVGDGGLGLSVQECQGAGGNTSGDNSTCYVSIVRAVPNEDLIPLCGSAICIAGYFCGKKDGCDGKETDECANNECVPYFDKLLHWNKMMRSIYPLEKQL